MTSYTDKGRKPEDGRFLAFDHITFWVSNAKQAASYYITRFGFEPLAYKGLETGSRKISSHAVRMNKMRSLKSRGAEIVTWPATYYELIKEKLKDSSVKVTESIEELKENNILIDFDERGYMLQAFTKHLQVRPTLFLEIIQRRNHRGFGAMNYQWVFEAIERLETASETKT